MFVSPCTRGSARNANSARISTSGRPASREEGPIIRISLEPERAADRGLVHLAAGEVVECAARRRDQVLRDERCAFLGALLSVLEAALPLQRRPAFVAELRQQREHGCEVDLPVAERTETTRAVLPVLVAAVHTRAPVRPELGVLHVEADDALVIELDVLQVVELLQHEVARVVEQARTRMLVDVIEE